MASIDVRFEQQFECPFCCHQVIRPKIMGSCFHSACRDCLEEYVTSLRASDAFKCPVCRQKCNIPRNGVADLKDDFKMISIMDIYGKLKDTTCIQCSNCANVVESVCERCDVFLCSACTKEHDIYSADSHEDEIVAICCWHGNTLSFYCKTCEQAFCSVCKLCSHKGVGHDVVTYSEAVEDTSAKMQVVLTKLEKEEHELLKSLDDVVEKTDDYALRSNVKRGIGDRCAKLGRLQEQSDRLQEVIKALKKQKVIVDKMCKQLTKDLTKLQGEDREAKNEMQEKSKRSQGNIKQAVRDLNKLKTEMRDKLQLVSSRKTPIDGQSVDTLKRIRHELSKSTIPVNSTLLENVKQLIRELELSDCDSDSACVDLSSMKTVVDLSFPEDRPCRGVFRVQSLSHGEVVILARSSLSNDSFSLRCFADTMYFAKNGTVHKTVTEGVWPASDIAVLPTGEVMLLRNKQPIIRLFNSDTGSFRDIAIETVKHTNKNGIRTTMLWSVETDLEGNTIVDFGQFPHQNLIVLKADGTIIRQKESRGLLSRWFASGHGTWSAYDTTEDQIVRYRGWDLPSLDLILLLQLMGIVLLFLLLDIAFVPREVPNGILMLACLVLIFIEITKFY